MPAPESPEAIILRCRQILAARPDDAAAHFSLGTALWTTGAQEAAIFHLDRAVELDPGDAGARNNYGNALSALGRFGAAAEQYRAALALRPGAPELPYNLGNMLLAIEAAAEAETCFRAALAGQPDHPGAHNNLGNALRGQGRHDEAIDCYRRALALRPDYFGTHNNIGSALLALHRPEDALPHFRQALALRPDYAEACNNLGGALLALDRPEEALLWFREATRHDPGHAQAQFGAAVALLVQGEFRDGWRAYEARWDNPQFRAEMPDCPHPHWDGGESVAGRTILLHAEQGLGDSIQFVRYAPLLRARGGRVTLSVPASLTALCAGLADQVLVQGEPFPPHDLHCPLMSLPLAFGTEPGTIPAATPYLHPDPARVAAWRDTLGPAPRPRVGIAWAGSAEHPEDALRSIPLADFLPPLRRAAVELHVVQTDISPADRHILAAAPEVAVHRAQLTDFAATAALLACLDLVITVDTSVAHLAGALGVPTWLLLQFSPDFRWMRDRADSPWYPTLTLFRQPALHDWGGVLARVSTSLAAFARGDT